MRHRVPLAPLVYVALLMTPVYWLVVMSLKTNAEIGGGLTLYPHTVSLANYALIFGEAELAQDVVAVKPLRDAQAPQFTRALTDVPTWAHELHTA